jgi:hypothetical protein
MAKMPTDSCAFLPCDQVDECAFGPGQCVQKRFGKLAGKASAVNMDTMKKGAKAHVGTKPARGAKKTR